MNGALPLPLPWDPFWAKGLLVLAFLCHLVAVNLALGGQALSLAARLWALWRPQGGPAWALAQRLSSRVVIAKSVLVVLGVGPLMLIQLAYGEAFVAATTLLAPVWLSLPPWIAAAFGLILLDRAAFAGWGARHPGRHAALGLAAAAMLWAVPWVYLAVTNLMIQPQAWAARPGFLEVIAHVGNVPARYAHLALASLAIAGLWLGIAEGREAAWRRPWPGEAEADPAWSPEALAQAARRRGAQVALGATALQFLAGPAVLFTLPAGALGWEAAVTLGLGVLAGVVALFAMADAAQDERPLSRAIWPLILALLLMGSTRHLIRERLLDPPQAAPKAPSLSP